MEETAVADSTTYPTETLQRMAASPGFYRSQLTIEVAGDAVRYTDVAADWQEDDFKAMDAAWLRCVGKSRQDVPRTRSWLERCRGASKTADLAISACWALAFASRPVKLISASGDKDQARLLRNAVRRLCELNPWLGSTLQVQQYTVRNIYTGSELEVLSSDAATGFGILADAILVDEVANWPETDSAEHFWHVISSTMTKKRNCLCLCISNAGRVDGWQWAVRSAIREDSNWYFHALATIPPWITESQLAEQRRLLPASVYERLWGNKWTSGTDSGLSPSDVEACCLLNGPQLNRLPQYHAYIAACDLGWRHDRTGLVVLAVNFHTRQIDLAHCESWNPADYNGELPLSVVEREIIWANRRFDFDMLLFDPAEATGLSQRLCHQGVACCRVSLNPTVQDSMAKLFLQSFNQRIIRLYRHPELLKDLLSLEVADRTTGLKLEAARNSGGHSDLAFAFAIALYGVCDEYQNRLRTVTPEILIA
jgi:hypothetical protein